MFAQFLLERTFANDLAPKRFSSFPKQPAGMDQIDKPLFCDQTTDSDNQRRIGRKIRAFKQGQIQAVVDAMNAIGDIWETLTQKFFCVIGLGDDHARCIDKLVQTDLEGSWREDVVGV